ncbi:MAG: DUF1146 family protein [Solobacterium sp.]|jgi:uncharacterized integral membrane protein (TIGR02327 family)|nr:DUF1146 family protein [Solobacterium sp.]MCH4050209.1 DUF1146 family protein [Solobacterium sp.]MCH4073932.1 DUF1146 family protein [Solobacterium sp.]MCI1313476.1 DUF1146 family protein [Solobacterium sp.]MCI1345776.1 DUF1146 family protein [Solobacterium sp.]
MVSFLVRALVYIACFVLSYWALMGLDYNRFLKQGHVSQGQVLFFLLAAGLAYLAGSFLLGIIYLPG